MKLFGNIVSGQTCTVQLEFATADGTPPPTVTLKNKKGADETLPVYSNKDTIKGSVKVTPIPGKRVEHQGIKVQLVGEIELASERGHPNEFVSLVRELAPPGEFVTQQTYPFEFSNVEMQYESYKGMQVRLRYLLRVTVVRGLGQSVVKDFPFCVRNFEAQPQAAGQPLKMEVGIEDCLHIEFEYDHSTYHLTDVVLGKIYFLLVRIKLKHMELEIRRRETMGAGTAARSESETVAKYEIMDGGPVRGEVIPIRMYLSPCDLTPTYDIVHNKFSVKYFLNLVLVDDEDRRYFKQQEIRLYRLSKDPSKTATEGPRKPRFASKTPTVKSASGVPDTPEPEARQEAAPQSTVAAAAPAAGGEAVVDQEDDDDFVVHEAPVLPLGGGGGTSGADGGKS